MKIINVQVSGLTAAAVAMSLLLLGACGDGESTSAAGSSAPASTGTALTQDCHTVVGSFRDMFKGLIKSDAGADQQAAYRKALTDYAATARGQAAKVGDPALRAAVEKHAVAAEKLSKAADPTKLDDADFEAATGEVEKLCADALKPKASPGAPTARVGAAGSACVLPVAFELLPLWKPEAVDPAELGELGGLYRNGPFVTACTVDAKPAGEIGTLRIALAAELRTGTPRAYLETFVESEFAAARKKGNVDMKNVKYSELTIGGQPAAEVTYEPYNKVVEHQLKYSAFAVNTPKGAVIVKLSPFGADEYVNLLPAYELAKTTLTVNG